MLRRLALTAVVLLTVAPAAAPAAEVERTPLEIPSETMEPTLPLGAWVDVDYHAYDRGRPGLGDIVIAHPPSSYRDDGDLPRCGVRRRSGQMCARGVAGLDDARIVKRVVGLAGDRLALRHGLLTRNGRAVAEVYAHRCSDLCHFPRTVTVPRGHVFLLSDNRAHWADSRVLGAVPAQALLGRVTACTPPAGETCGRLG